MPVRLNVGVSKKVGLPEYSSVGASVHLEVELDSGTLDDLDGFHARARDVFVAAHQAVNDELARLRGGPAPPGAAPLTSVNGDGHRNGHSPPTYGSSDRARAATPRINSTRGRPTRPATPGQVKALHAIARAQR